MSFCRNTERVFLREHLARWVPSIAGRISLAAKGGFHGAAASALSAFIEWEEGFRFAWARLSDTATSHGPWIHWRSSSARSTNRVRWRISSRSRRIMRARMDRLRRLSPGAWAFVFAAAVAIVGGVVSPVPVRSQVPRLDATPAPTAIPNDDPWSAVWEGAPSRQVLLSAQQITPPFGGGGVASLTVRALHDNGRVFILLEWYDDDVDDAVNGSGLFADAAALQFPAVAGDEPAYTMGSADHPVSIWQWKAVWQADIDRGFATGLSRYPDTAVDTYPNRDDPRYNPARYVGNQLADSAHVSPRREPHRRRIRYVDLRRGARRLGCWLVAERDVAGAVHSGLRLGCGDRNILRGEDTLVAFAVWDGGRAIATARNP